MSKRKRKEDGDVHNNSQPGAESHAPLCLRDQLLHFTKGVDAGLIQNKARVLAGRLREPALSLDDFRLELNGIFPELRYFGTLDGVQGVVDEKGQPGAEEYQRTVNCLENVYHLARLSLPGASSGRLSFVFGSNAAGYLQRSEGAAAPHKWFDCQCKFMEEFEAAGGWTALQTIMDSAGMADEEMLMGMLVLSAIHDIFKVEALKQGHAADHDLALEEEMKASGAVLVEQAEQYQCYTKARHKPTENPVLQHSMLNAQTLIPSFYGLPAHLKERLIATTEGYNHGWFVQAETTVATALPEVPILKDKSLMALYAVHWITDVGGANPANPGGSSAWLLWGRFGTEKLLPMVDAFNTLTASIQEGRSQAYFQWIQACYERYMPPGTTTPVGSGAIARMRLVAMTQEHAVTVEKAWAEFLSAEDQQLLGAEMALTGIEEEPFPGLPAGSASSGPALSLKFMPQYMREHSEEGPGEAAAALHNLAGLIRKVRLERPLEDSQGSQNIDVILSGVVGKGSGNYMDAAQEAFELKAVNAREFTVHHQSPTPP